MTTHDDPLALDRQVCFALAVTNRTVLSIYRPLLEPLGLTHPQYLVMLVLWERGPVTIKEIGTLVELDSATLSPLLKRLERAGLLTRVRSTADERAVVIGLTEAGTALRTQAETIPPRVVAALGGDLTLLERLRDVLWRVNDNAKGTPA